MLRHNFQKRDYKCAYYNRSQLCRPQESKYNVLELKNNWATTQVDTCKLVYVYPWRLLSFSQHRLRLLFTWKSSFWWHLNDGEIVIKENQNLNHGNFVTSMENWGSNSRNAALRWWPDIENSGGAKVSGDLSKSQETGMSQSINQTLLQMLEFKNI